MLTVSIIVKILFGVITIVSLVALLKEGSEATTAVAKYTACALLIVAACLFLAASKPGTGGQYEAQRKQLDAYVDWFHQTVQPKYARRAKRLVPITIKYADKHGVDPLLMGCVFSFESSWRNFVGSLGEQGPGHLMPDRGRKKKRIKWRTIDGERYDLMTIEGQIDGACAHMRMSIDACKNMVGVFSHYGSGKCRLRNPSAIKKMKYRARHYRRMKKRFGG